MEAGWITLKKRKKAEQHFLVGTQTLCGILFGPEVIKVAHGELREDVPVCRTCQSKMGDK